MEPTTFESLPLELYLIIASNLLTLTDKLSARQANPQLHKAIHFMEVKLLCMSHKIFHRSQRPHICINVDCDIWQQMRCGCRYGCTKCTKTTAMGLTTFYYPEDLLEPHDYEGDPYGPNYEFPHRVRICRESPSVRRYIPYCQDCMIQYVNFGSREDELEVPYDGGGLNGAHGQGLPYGINNF